MSDRSFFAGPGGEGLPSWFMSGDGGPGGVVTPSQKGALYQDTTNGALYVATGETSADWFTLGGLDFDGTSERGVVTEDEGTVYVVGGPTEFATSLELTDYSHNNSVLLQSTDDPDEAVRIQGSGGAYWVFLKTGGLKFASLAALRATSGAPTPETGADGDWSFATDGHIYFKTGGSWVQKV
jgi:hypothetical protein